jgi:hypothetical protein
MNGQRVQPEHPSLFVDVANNRVAEFVERLEVAKELDTA